MSRGPHTFKQRDLTRAIKAVAAAGIKNPVAEIDRDGKLRVFGGDNVSLLQNVQVVENNVADTSWDDDAPEITAAR